MRKILNLILILLLLTGCTFEYNITINKDTVDEISNILNYDEFTWDNEDILYAGVKYKDRIQEMLKTPSPVYKNANINPYDVYTKIDGVEYYNQTLISSSNEYGIKYKYKFPINRYKDSINASMCYDEFNVDNNKKTIKIKTSQKFNCFDLYERLDEVVINIKVSEDYKVVSNNSDKNQNRIYTWVITRETALNKPIEIELDIENKINWGVILTITISILFVIIIAYFILKNKIAKNNQI